MSKSSILARVVVWLHNDAVAPVQEDLWRLAKDAIAGDVYGLDLSVPDWDLAHCEAHESVWFYAALMAGHVFTRDGEGLQSAGVLYREEVGRVGTSFALRAVKGQMGRPYGA